MAARVSAATALLALAAPLGCARTVQVVSLDASPDAGRGAERDAAPRADGAAPSLGDYAACLALDGPGCFECCTSSFEDPVPVEATERYCLCVSPRPCEDLCDATYCGDAVDPALERACLDCRRRVERDAACAANYRLCLEDPYCAAFAECAERCP